MWRGATGHCEWYEYVSVRYLLVRVSGKTGERHLIAKHEAVAELRRLHSRQQDLCGLDFDRVLDIAVNNIPIIHQGTGLNFFGS